MSLLAALDRIPEFTDADLIEEVARALLTPRRLEAFEAEALGFVQRRAGATALLLVLSDGQAPRTLGSGPPLALALLRRAAESAPAVGRRHRVGEVVTEDARVLFLADDPAAGARVARIADLVARAARLALDYERLYKTSITDPLTGLYNRRFLAETLARELSGARRHRRPLALLALDLDGFKQINDRLGHAEGDRLLAAVAAVLMRVTRKSDIAARTGGDEFVVLMPGASQARADAAARRIAGAVRRLAETGQLAGEHSRFSVSIGIAHADGDPAVTPEDLLSCADRGMYQCKRGKKGAEKRAAVI